MTDATAFRYRLASLGPRPNLSDDEDVYWRSAAMAVQRARLWELFDARLAADEADRVSRTLLLRHLDANQKRMFERWQCFEVDAASGRRYRIRAFERINIDVLASDGGVDHCLCVRSDAPLPVPDLMLAQKLMLDANEDGLLRVANVYPGWQLLSRRLDRKLFRFRAALWGWVLLQSLYDAVDGAANPARGTWLAASILIQICIALGCQAYHWRQVEKIKGLEQELFQLYGPLPDFG